MRFYFPFCIETRWTLRKSASLWWRHALWGTWSCWEICWSTIGTRMSAIREVEQGCTWQQPEAEMTFYNYFWRVALTSQHETALAIHHCTIVVTQRQSVSGRQWSKHQSKVQCLALLRSRKQCVHILANIVGLCRPTRFQKCQVSRLKWAWSWVMLAYA